MKLQDFTNCLIICSFIFILISLQYLTVNNENFKYFNETREGLHVVYYHNSYYCVWTKDRTEAEIALVDNHEQCHHFVNMRKEHFCD